MRANSTSDRSLSLSGSRPPSSASSSALAWARVGSIFLPTGGMIMGMRELRLLSDMLIRRLSRPRPMRLRAAAARPPPYGSGPSWRKPSITFFMILETLLS